jgi:hypothetical protein
MDVNKSSATRHLCGQTEETRDKPERGYERGSLSFVLFVYGDIIISKGELTQKRMRINFRLGKIYFGTKCVC